MHIEKWVVVGRIEVITIGMGLVVVESTVGYVHFILSNTTHVTSFPHTTRPRGQLWFVICQSSSIYTCTRQDEPCGRQNRLSTEWWQALRCWFVYLPQCGDVTDFVASADSLRWQGGICQQQSGVSCNSESICKQSQVPRESLDFLVCIAV